MDRLDRKLGLLGDNSQQRRRGPGWASPILLPILQRLDAHADELRELGLRQARTFADRGLG